MVISANSDFSTVTIQSDNLTDFTDIDTVTLSAKVNCEGSYSDTIIEGDVTLLTGTFTVDLLTLFGSSTLADSIYSFVLTILYNDETVDVEYGCLFVDNETKCNVAQCVKDKQMLELQLDHWIITASQDCNCNCENLCTIYKRMLNELSSCQSC